MKLPQPVPPGAGQESVWDYPRPPRLEASTRHIRIIFNGTTLAETRRALRVLETSHPPTYYLPPDDIAMTYLTPTAQRSFCEWKGQARYYTITVEGVQQHDAAWSYPNPTAGFEALKDSIAFYPARMEACFVDGEVVKPQGTGFYGGWITSDLTGPFKVGPGLYE
jgi:uncharacterized protein (DUF427 family)